MKNISATLLLIIVTILWMASSCNFPSQSPEPEDEVEIIEPTATIEIIPTSTPSNLETYSSDEYSFTYPNDYTITLPKLGFPVLTIYKADNKRMEIFQMEDFGDRPFGFSGTETQEEIDGYLPKVKIAMRSGGHQYDIWLFYSEGDQETIEELYSIILKN